MENSVVITEHAYKRAKERYKWKAKVLDKMANKAFLEGVKHSETKGRLNKHINRLWMRYRTANNIRIYGEDIFFFVGNKLITLYRLESEYIKYLNI